MDYAGLEALNYLAKPSVRYMQFRGYDKLLVGDIIDVCHLAGLSDRKTQFICKLNTRYKPVIRQGARRVRRREAVPRRTRLVLTLLKLLSRSEYYYIKSSQVVCVSVFNIYNIRNMLNIFILVRI